MNTEYGLDAHYFKKKLEIIVRDVRMYTPEEMELALTRLAAVAGSQKKDMTKGQGNE